MNSYLNLTGKWIGYYSFGPEYGEDLHGEKVKFILSLTQKNFKIEGTSVDTDGIGSSFQKATIKGFIKDNFISLIKQYPVFLQFDEKNNLIQNPSKMPPEIHYTGYYDEGKELYTGEWEMVEKTESDFFGDTEFLNSGRWEMYREE